MSHNMHGGRRIMRTVAWGMRVRLQRWGTAWRYAMDRINASDAYDLKHDVEAVTGIYCLELFSKGDVMQLARERWGNFPDMEEMVEDACGRVGFKWTSTGDVRHAAEDWALDLVADYAEARGLYLVELADAAPAGWNVVETSVEEF